MASGKIPFPKDNLDFVFHLCDKSKNLVFCKKCTTSISVAELLRRFCPVGSGHTYKEFSEHTTYLNRL